MMVTTVVNTFKTSRTQLINFVLKSEFGRNGSICAFDSCYKTSLIKLFNTNSCLESIKKFRNLEGKLIKRDGTVVRLKTNPEDKVSVLNERNEVTVMTLFDAQKLAAGKGLNLTQLKRTRGQQMDVYKMVTDKELIKTKGDMKQYVFKSKITDHDLSYKMKHLMAAMNKNGSVQLSLKFLDSDPAEMESFVQKIKSWIKQSSYPAEMVQTDKTARIKSYIIQKIDSDNVETETNKNKKETNKKKLAD